MSDALWGVIIGAAIGSVAPTIGSIVDFLKWKNERHHTILREKRDRREKLYDTIIQQIIEGNRIGAFDIPTIASIVKLCPKEVSQSFNNMMLDEDRSAERFRQHLVSICSTMKADISKIEKEIEAN